MLLLLVSTSTWGNIIFIIFIIFIIIFIIIIINIIDLRHHHGHVQAVAIEPPVLVRGVEVV